MLTMIRVQLALIMILAVPQGLKTVLWARGTHFVGVILEIVINSRFCVT